LNRSEGGPNASNAMNQAADGVNPGRQTHTGIDGPEQMRDQVKERERLSPEEIQAIIDDTFEIADEILARSGGSSSDTLNDAEKERPVDPIIIDLDGDGVEIVASDDFPFLFDIDGDGFEERTDWFASGDGLLVLDVNGDGEINSVKEVISASLDHDLIAGDEDNSLIALAKFDADDNKVLDSNDFIFDQLKVWVDSDQDSYTDPTELKSLAEIGIQSIDLTMMPNTDRQTNNTLLGHTNAQTDTGQLEIAVVNFLTDPVGVSWEVLGNTLVTTTEEGDKIASVRGLDGSVLDIAAHDADIGHGSFGDDHLIGSSGDDLLIGYRGNDRFDAGAGNDWIVANYEDDLQNLDAGDGFDMVQFVGDERIVFDMGRSNVEFAYGDAGNDIFVANSNHNAFVAGGAGNDLIVGGSADDILNGEEGFDEIHGGSGDDLLRGHRGDDRLSGGDGTDLLQGGLGDDVLKGGKGDDVLQGGLGNDYLDGGEGLDAASFSGKIDEYRFEKTEEGYLVTDTIENRDGISLLVNIEQMFFTNIGEVKLDGESPIALADHLNVSDWVQPDGSILIHKSDLLANDVDFQENEIFITKVENSVGGQAELTASGDVRFIPDPGYIGLPSFTYSVEDSAGNTGLNVRYRRIDGDIITPHKGLVTFDLSDLPDDPMLKDQWYLHNTNIPAV